MDDFLRRTLNALEHSNYMYGHRGIHIKTELDLINFYFVRNESNELLSKIKYIMNVDYLSDQDFDIFRRVVEDFENNLKSQKYSFRLVDNIAYEAFISNRETLKELDEKDGDYSIYLDKFKDFEIEIINNKNLIELKKILEDKKNFIENFKDILFNENSNIDDIKKFIVKNYNILKENDSLIYQSNFKNYLNELNDRFIIVADNLCKDLLNNKVVISGMANHHYAYSKGIKGSDYNMFEFLNKFIKDDNNFYGVHGVSCFEDDTLIIEKKLNEFEVLNSKKEKLDFKNKICSKFLRNKYNKNPNICKEFIEIIESNKHFNVSKSFELFELYFNNIAIFKKNEIYIKDIVLNNDIFKYDKKIENAYDILTYQLREHEINKVIKNITSNKNIDLFDSENRKIVGEIINQKIKNKYIEEYIGKKIAKYKTPEELNLGLNRLLNMFGDNYDGVMNKVENYDVDIFKNENNILILNIENFEQSKNIGSPSWCISTQLSYFESYVDKEEGQKQYFIYDFNKNLNDPLSLVGLTVDKNNNFIASHMKNDDELFDKDEIVLKYLKMLKTPESKKVCRLHNN